MLAWKAPNALRHFFKCLSSAMGRRGFTANSTQARMDSGREEERDTPLSTRCMRCIATQNSTTLSCPSSSISDSLLCGVSKQPTVALSMYRQQTTSVPAWGLPLGLPQTNNMSEWLLNINLIALTIITCKMRGAGPWSVNLSCKSNAPNSTPFLPKLTISCLESGEAAQTEGRTLVHEYLRQRQCYRNCEHANQTDCSMNATQVLTLPLTTAFKGGYIKTVLHSLSALPTYNYQDSVFLCTGAQKQLLMLSDFYLPKILLLGKCDDSRQSSVRTRLV